MAQGGGKIYIKTIITALHDSLAAMYCYLSNGKAGVVCVYSSEYLIAHWVRGPSYNDHPPSLPGSPQVTQDFTLYTDAPLQSLQLRETKQETSKEEEKYDEKDV